MEKEEKFENKYFKNKKLPIYNYDIYLDIVISNDRYELSKYISKTYLKNDFLFEFDSAGAVTLYEYGNVIVVFDLEYIYLPTIIHESVHAANKVFLKLDEETIDSHCFVYLVEWIASEINKFFQEENLIEIKYLTHKTEEEK